MGDKRRAALPRDVPLELGAIAGPVVLTAAWLVLGFVSPGYTLWGVHVAPYSWISQPISGLGLDPTGPYMNAAFIASGLLMVVGSAGIFMRIPNLTTGKRWILGTLLALPGLGGIADGIFTFRSFFMHFLGFALALTAIVTLPVAGYFVRRVPGWRTLGTGLVLAGPLTLALTVLYFATFTPTIEGIQTGIAGLTERVLILELQAWYVAMGWVAFSTRDQLNRQPAQATASTARKHEMQFNQGEIR